MPTVIIRLIRKGERKEVWRGWGETCRLHCNHQNDSCIKMGSDKSHFNVSLIVRDRVTRQCQQMTSFEKNEKPKQIRTVVPLLISSSKKNRISQ